MKSLGGEIRKMVSREIPLPDHVLTGNYIGRCPICDAPLTKHDIKEKQFKGILHTHHAYVCKVCNRIIGFSAAHV